VNDLNVLVIESESIIKRIVGSCSIEAIKQDSPCMSCNKSYCCKRNITITLLEGLVIVKYLRQSGDLPRVIKICESYLKKYKNVNDLAWFTSEIPCPLLKDSKCLAYEVRPIECASHLVRSKPFLCTPRSSDEYERINMEDVIYKDVLELLKLTEDRALVAQLPLYEAILISSYIMKYISIKPDTDDSILSNFNL